MNSIPSFNCTMPQNTFTGKKPKTKDVYKVIDKASDTAAEYLHKDRPLAEKKEFAIKKSINNFYNYVKNIIINLKYKINKKLNTKSDALTEAKRRQEALDALREYFKNFE